MLISLAAFSLKKGSRLEERDHLKKRGSIDWSYRVCQSSDGADSVYASLNMLKREIIQYSRIHYFYCSVSFCQYYTALLTTQKISYSVDSLSVLV